MEDLQSLLEKINRDGVEKAEAEAKSILADAKAKANSIIESARAEAAAEKAGSEKAAADYAARAQETIRQAARDTVLKVEAALTALLERLLVKDVETALADEATVTALVREAVKGIVGEAEVAAPAKLVPALKAQLAALGSITVVTDETLGTGVSVKTDGGRVESAFTADVIAAELAKRLRPDLAKLLK